MLYKILLLWHLTVIHSTLVLDSKGQKSVYVTDYCPQMKYCPEGAHIMCMYYNANNKMGPRCANAENITITHQLANKLMDVSNAVRSRIANGKETGKDGIFLPRGYGIFRLKWDTELATFAQVLANQCVLRHDLCRATNRFPDPGQTAGLVRFSYPDWFPVSKSGQFNESGMNLDKLVYATTQILKSWYMQKNSVTSSMITNYPDWSLQPNNQHGRLYLEMIYGSATHMGCGISAYTEYSYYDNNAPLTYNSVQIICNFSGRARKGTAVFNTVPPGDTEEPFSRCGCPAGSESDDECLCQVSINPTTPSQAQLHHGRRKCLNGQNCDPTVVVLPIFTVEDAPPEKLLTYDSFANTSLRDSMDADVFRRRENDLFHSKRNFYGSDKVNKAQEYGSNAKTLQKLSPSQQNIRRTHHVSSVRKRYFDKDHMESKPQKRHPSRATHNAARKKSSIFSRAAKFELPGSLSMRPIKQTGIKDVVPRKDFSTAKQRVNKYLYGTNDLNEQLNNDHAVQLPRDTEAIDSQRRNNVEKTLFNDIIHDGKNEFNKNEPLKTETKHEGHTAEEQEAIYNMTQSHHLPEVFYILNSTKPLKVSKDISQYQNSRLTTETVLNKAEQKVMLQDSIFEQLVSNTHDYPKTLNSVTEETDNKLMALLDTLEQEVKHVELRDKDKQLFDAKIRKIYGKLVGKSVNLLDLNINKRFYTKPNDKHDKNDVQDSRTIKQIVQQKRKEEPIDENYRKKTDEQDEHNSRRLETKHKNNDQIRNISTIRNKYETEKYDERRFNLREIKHSDTSHEQMQDTHHEFESDRQFGERKIYRNYNFDTNSINEDELRYRGTENKFRDRNNERGRRRDEAVEHRNENDLERRSRSEHRHRKNNAMNEDPLSMERRRFYQEKLENIERNLQMRNHKHTKDSPRHMRPMRPATRKSENQMDIYGRARFAHGY